jgi:hypothetical protein
MNHRISTKISRVTFTVKRIACSITLGAFMFTSQVHAAGPDRRNDNEDLVQAVQRIAQAQPVARGLEAVAAGLEQGAAVLHNLAQGNVGENRNIIQRLAAAQNVDQAIDILFPGVPHDTVHGYAALVVALGLFASVNSLFGTSLAPTCVGVFKFVTQQCFLQAAIPLLEPYINRFVDRAAVVAHSTFESCKVHVPRAFQACKNYVRGLRFFRR